MISYEEPTNELRQVKRPIKRGNDICGPGYYEVTTGYDITVQRKWLIHSQEDYKGAENWRTTKEEWRDLPTVSDPKAP